MTKSLKSLLAETGKSSFKNQEKLAIGKENGFAPKAAYSLINKSLFKIKRGLYSLEIPSSNAPVPPEMPQTAIANIAFRGVASVSNDEVYVPTVDPTYIKWGEYNTIMIIIK